MNSVNTFEGVYTTRNHKLYWQTDYGLLRYIPTETDKISLAVYDQSGETVRSSDCQISDGEVTIVFPDDLSAGFYTYDISLVKDEKLIHKTEGTLHVGRR